VISNNQPAGLNSGAQIVFQVGELGFTVWREHVFLKQALDSCQLRVLGMKQEVQIAPLFMVPGIREWTVVDSSQGGFEKRAENSGGITTITKAEEKGFQSILFVLPVTGEMKNALRHAKDQPFENPRCVGRVRWNIKV
jgi:hypothetical protein